jgi:hypothetical protein
MLFATLVGIMFAPALYALFQRMREFFRKPANLPDAPSAEARAAISAEIASQNEEEK